MIKKNILVLLTGQLRSFSKKNYENLIENFKGYKLDFFVVYWENQDKDVINTFSSIYNPIKFKDIKNQNFYSEVKEIKIPDNAVNPENIFHMWHSFSEGCKEIKKFQFENKPDYILRYRSDILPDINQDVKSFDLLKKQVLIPDRYHWNGINDQFFLFNYSDLEKFSDVNKFLKSYQKKNLLFSPELIFQRFLKSKGIQIKYVNYNYKIMRREKKINKIEENKKIIKIPLYDKLTIKFNKLKFKIRNFNNFFLKKNIRNNQQDIVIK